MNEKKDSSFIQWSYWRDKYGQEEALKTYYPNLLKSDARLSMALLQIECVAMLIEKIMEDYTEKEEAERDKD